MTSDDHKAMTSDDHKASGQIDRISRAMDRQPRFINVKIGDTLPAERKPFGLCLTLGLCISAGIWIAGWWLIFG